MSQFSCQLRHLFLAVQMSGRSCSAARRVFFIAQAQPFEAVPEGCDPKADSQVRRDAFLKLAQGEIGLLFDPASKRGVVLFQTRAPVAASLARSQTPGVAVQLPVTFHAALGNREESRNFLRALTSLSGRHDPFP